MIVTVHNGSAVGGTVAYELTRADDPNFLLRSYVPLPAGGTLHGDKIRLRDHALYHLTVKHYDDDSAQGNVLQTITQDADLTTENQVDLTYSIDQ